MASLLVATVIAPGLGASCLVVGVFLLGVVLAQTHPSLAVCVAVSIGLSAGFTRRVLDFFAPQSTLVPFIVLLPSIFLLSVILIGRPKKLESPRPQLPLFWKLLAIAVVLSGVSPFGAGLVTNLATSSFLLISVLSFVLSFTAKVDFSRVVIALIIVGSLNSLYMIGQHFFGLTPWDNLWVSTDGYAALHLTATEVRPLGIASSAAESAALSSVTYIVAISLLKFGRPVLRPLFLILAFTALVAVTLSGTRTFLILSVLGTAVLLTSGRRRPFLALAGVLAVLVPAVVLVSSRLSGIQASGAARSLTTFSGEEDLSTSTIPLHFELLINGLIHGVSSVIGTGSGQMGRLGANVGNTEIDLGNLPVMAGVVGFVAVIAMYWIFFKNLGFTLSYGGVQLQSALILVAFLGQWLAVGFYGMLAVAWLSFGELCRSKIDRIPS